MGSFIFVRTSAHEHVVWLWLQGMSSRGLEALERPEFGINVNRIQRPEFEKSGNGRAFSDEDSSRAGGRAVHRWSTSSSGNSECRKKIEDDLITCLSPRIHFITRKRNISQDWVGRGSNNLFVFQNSGFGPQKMMNTPKYSESLQLCTEGLGFESSNERDADSVSVGSEYSSASSACFPTKPGVEWENLNSELERRLMIDAELPKHLENAGIKTRNHYVSGTAALNDKNFHQHCHATAGPRRPRAINNFPPPLPSRNGHRWVFHKSYGRDGRLFLHEVKVSRHDFLHLSQGDGRLKLHLLHEDEDADAECRSEKDLRYAGGIFS
eukprot:Gb_27751 [translate_table: standard]